MRCDTCDGNKRIEAHTITRSGPKRILIECHTCNGEGWLSEEAINRIKVGGELRALRQSRDISQMEAAKLIGVSVQEYSKMECGKVNPKPEAFKALTTPLIGL